MSDADVMGIYWWVEDGIKHYRCRGIGPKYTKFYREWIPSSSYKPTGEDWPWDYFIFTNPEDHNRLVADFPGDVIEDWD
jgi:hypothetical protein